MNKEKTVMTFDTFGNVTINHTGFVGKACTERTAELMKGLAATKTADNKNPDFYKQQQVGVRLGR